jgi:hypothetical protein
MAVREEQGMDAKMMKAPYVEEGEGSKNVRRRG